VSWPQIAEYVDAAPQFVIGVKDDSSKLELQERLYILQHTKAFPFLYHLVPEPIPSIRSRNIRANIRRGKIPAAIALPVADYIKANQLYHG
jgi:nicotinic acid mononucleotide adenylyltransferase